ncbi:acyl-CoA carboxylase subunit epsilon [Kitasatospora herbaricolor]|uniref:Acyl-CoA carboxylase subunit epsilon n=1 Tax=Kitasatospora herbaricolor TaxID=68217 RepID=A0ABZ1WJS5_9ACTN|nr:acyl-CoA carboxylase subunit epsilon [Kitasatospora herbaricolor]
MTHPDHPDHPAALHVLHGDPDPLELAVLTAVLLAARRTRQTPAPRAGARPQAAWRPPAPSHRRPSWKTPP